LKECTKSDATRVLDINGDLKSEGSTPKQPEEEEKL